MLELQEYDEMSLIVSCPVVAQEIDSINTNETMNVVSVIIMVATGHENVSNRASFRC
jgi:hypothetical protein